MYRDRVEAGKLLSKKLTGFHGNRESVVLAIPRGGVVVAYEMSKALNLPLEAVTVKKLGAPQNPELAIGAITLSQIKYLDWDLINRLNVSEDYLSDEIERKGREVEEGNRLYGFEKARLKIFANFIVVDDGIATGATTRAVVNFIRSITSRGQIILAVPVVAFDVYNQLIKEVAKIIALEKPKQFGAVGQFYRKFAQVNEKEVVDILKKSKLN